MSAQNEEPDVDPVFIAEVLIPSDDGEDRFAGRFEATYGDETAGGPASELPALVDWGRDRSPLVLVKVGDDQFSAGSFRVEDEPEWKGQGADAVERFWYQTKPTDPPRALLEFDYAAAESERLRLLLAGVNEIVSVKALAGRDVPTFEVEMTRSDSSIVTRLDSILERLDTDGRGAILDADEHGDSPVMQGGGVEITPLS